MRSRCSIPTASCPEIENFSQSIFLQYSGVMVPIVAAKSRSSAVFALCSVTVAYRRGWSMFTVWRRMDTRVWLPPWLPSRNYNIYDILRTGFAVPGTSTRQPSSVTHSFPGVFCSHGGSMACHQVPLSPCSLPNLRFDTFFFSVQSY